jgi:hypothetical protein
MPSGTNVFKNFRPIPEKKLPCQVYFHFKVLIMYWRSFFKKSFTMERESSFGVASKYNAPRKKCFTESVRKNWLAVAVSPSSVK